MDRWKACTLPLFSVTLIALAAIGCSGKSGNEAAAVTPDKPLEPVTLKLYESGGYFTEQDFQELIAGPVKKKYPHLTVERKVNGDLTNLVAAGETVDFFVTWHGAMSTYKPLGLYADITPLAKKHNFDLNRFIPQGLEQLRESALKDPKFKQLFGMDIPELRGKRLESIFKSTNAPIPSTSIYYSKASSLLTAEYINAVTDKKDVNSALRDAQEQIQKYVESEKKK
jgi:multiple sugar transport system substrate-binding protein